MAIRLRFTQDRGFNPWLVRRWTWCEFDHVDLDWGGGQYLGARPDGGVQIRPADYHKPIKEIFGVIDILTPSEERQFRQFMKDQIGKPYDWSCIYGLAIHRDWRNPDAWDCSELMTAGFEHVKRPALNAMVNVNRISPRDLFLTPYLQLELPARLG